MLSSKANIICLLQILWDYSDAENILSMKDIKSKMKLLYDREIDRRTVYDCLNALNQLGYDISMFEENKEGHCLRERIFDVSEVRLLMDSVYANNTIPARYSMELIQKLQNLLSKPKRKLYNSMKCHKYILDQVIMRFGTDIQVVPNDDETFTATLYANLNGMYVIGLTISRYLRDTSATGAERKNL